MSRSTGLSASRVTYSVRNCWSTEMPNRYSLVAPSGMPNVTTVNADTKTSPADRVKNRPRGPVQRRHSQPTATSPARQPTWPTVVSACS